MKVPNFLLPRYRQWLGNRITANGDALQVARRERVLASFGGVEDPAIENEIERREQRQARLLNRLKEVS